MRLSKALRQGPYAPTRGPRTVSEAAGRFGPERRQSGNMSRVLQQSASRRGETLSRSAAMRRVQRMREREAAGRPLTERQARDASSIRRSATTRAAQEARRRRAGRPRGGRIGRAPPSRARAAGHQVRDRPGDGRSDQGGAEGRG
jgi:hypothetical protein